MAIVIQAMIKKWSNISWSYNMYTTIGINIVLLNVGIKWILQHNMKLFFIFTLELTAVHYNKGCALACNF